MVTDLRLDLVLTVRLVCSVCGSNKQCLNIRLGVEKIQEKASSSGANGSFNWLRKGEEGGRREEGW